MGTVANVIVGVATVTVTPITGGPAAPVTIGFTTDGVTMAIKSSFADIKVEEVVGTIKRILTDQEVTVSINIAEADLNNLVMSIPGSSLSGAILTLGGSILQEYSMVLVGKAPPPAAGLIRTITLNHVNPTGEVGMPFKKGEVSVVPVTFSCLVDAAGEFGNITDS